MKVISNKFSILNMTNLTNTCTSCHTYVVRLAQHIGMFSREIRTFHAPRRINDPCCDIIHNSFINMSLISGRGITFHGTIHFTNQYVLNINMIYFKHLLLSAIC